MIVITSQSVPVFADADVLIAGGSSVPGCEKTNQCFIPYQVTIDVGDHVVWQNQDSAAHTVTTGSASGGPDGNLDVFLNVADALDKKFLSSGTFPYFCMVHPWMTGKVIVKESIKQSSISLDDITPVLSIDSSIKFSGKLTSEGNPLSGKTVWVNVESTDGKTKRGSAITDSNGYFSAEAHFWGFDTGFWYIDAEFEGDSKFSSSYSLRDGLMVTYSNVPQTPPPTTPPATPPPSTQPSTPLATPTPTTAPTQTDVKITSGSSVPGCEKSNSCFLPYTMNTKVGQTITWYNGDSAAHTVTSGSISSGGVNGVFDSSLMLSGKTFVHKFTSSGNFPYFCMVHPWMVGEVIVGSSGSSISSDKSLNLKVPIVVFTDKSSYNKGDVIEISGQIKSVLRGFLVTLSIVSPDGAIMSSSQVDIDKDRKFSVGVPADGANWKKSGKYTVKAIYGTEFRMAETTFDFTSLEKISTTQNTEKSQFMAYASEADVVIASGSSAPGCELTSVCYEPVWVFGKVGEKIIWYNADSASHTVTSGNPRDGPDGVINSGVIMPGDIFTHEITNTRNLAYFCQIHPWMQGQVIVEYDKTYKNDSSINTMYDFRDALLNIPTYPSSIMKFKIVFVNSVDEKCTERNYESLKFYREVARNYLSWYGIDSHSITPSCITEDEYGKLLDEVASMEVDLVILMTDSELSETHSKCGELATTWGCFWIKNGVSSVVSNSDTWKTQGNSQAMVLSHELSHFVLYNKGEPESVWKQWVHDVQDQMDNCAPMMDIPLYGVEYLKSITSNCPSSLYRVIYADGKSVPVMRPYYEDKIQFDSRTSLELNKLPATVTEEQRITFSGSLSTIDGHPVGYAKINIIEEDGGSYDDILASTKTNQYGQFSIDWIVKDTDFWDNTLEIFASFSGDNSVQQNRTSIQNITIR